MNHKYILSTSVLILIIILTGGCKRDEFNWGTKIGNITYSGNVVFLGAEELALIKEVSANRVVFIEEAGSIKKITGKSILVMGVSEKTPYGLLRHVSSVQMNGTEVLINTTNALLEEAIKEGTIRFQRKLLEKDFKLSSKIEGILTKGPDKSFDGLAVTLQDLQVFNDGTNIARLNGAIGISPEIDITIIIRDNKISEIKFVTTLNKIDEVTVSSSGVFSGTKEIMAAEFIHSPIVIDSLVFVPEIIISCGFEGSASSAVSSGVRQDRSITSRMNYQNSQWVKDPLTQSESYDFIRPQLTNNTNLEIFSGPEININLFGIPIQTIKVTGFYLLEAQRTRSPFWKLFIGSDGQNTAKAEILGLREDYTTDLSIQASEIGSANSK